MYSPTYKNLCGFSIRFVFAKSVAETRNEIIHKSGTKEFCGVVGLMLQKDVYRKSAEIGYWLGEPFWGKGITTEAVGQIVKYGFQNLKLIRIFAGAFEFNIGSMKVLERNGFKKEGIAKKAVFKNGGIWGEHKYFILDDQVEVI